MLFVEQRVKIIKETILSRDTLTRHLVSKERYRSQKLRFYLVLLLLYSSSFAFYTFISITHIQSTLVISNSKGLTEILRDIRTSTYQS